MKNLPFLLLAFLLLNSCSSTQIQPPGEPIHEPEKPAPVQPLPGLESTCPAKGQYKAVDLATPVTQRFLDVAKYLGIETICRYYDWEQETIRGKTLKEAELRLLQKNGFNACVVFQHNNRWARPDGTLYNTFTAERGSIDAKRSLDLARGLQQPRGSTIFFGVDFDAYTATHKAAVLAYFRQATPLIRAAGFEVGAYGNGTALSMLLDHGLIKHAWLSMSTGHSGTREFNASNRWAMKQTLPRKCGGLTGDWNIVNPAFHIYGQWKGILQ